MRGHETAKWKAHQGSLTRLPKRGARTKRGTPCQCPAVCGVGRCKLHGGGKALRKRYLKEQRETKSDKRRDWLLRQLDRSIRNRETEYHKNGNHLTEAYADTQVLHGHFMEAVREGRTTVQARAIEHELAFHAWVYENAGHDILLTHWERLAPLVRIYLSVHNNVHGAHGEFRHMTTEYLECAVGESLDEMMDHIERHMNQGLSAVLRVLPAAE